jgi:hypothetical protein
MKMTILATLAATMIIALPLAAQQGNPGAHFIENWDLDGDGKVTIEEATQKRGEIFYMFDQDQSGALEPVEYDLFDEARNADMAENAGGPGGPMKGVSQGMVREFNDVDGDGKVSEEEFRSRAIDWFAMMDGDGDGLVTTEDFGR